MDHEFDAEIDEKTETQPCPSMGELDGNQSSLSKKYTQNFKRKREFIGWGSRPLIDFLVSIGKHTCKPLSQHEVLNIINAYINENKLTHPEKKKKVLCDAKLQLLFRRKSVNRNKIYYLLELHFSENLEDSEDGMSDNSDEKCKRQKMANPSMKKHEKEVVVKTPRSCFASVTAENVKMVYLRRSLVEKFLKNKESFDEKVCGSFVRIKSDPNDLFYQIMQVTGTKKASGVDNVSDKVVVQVSSINKEVPVRMLSDDDFCEEEIEDLHKRVKDGLHQKLTIVELEHKAKSLHEEIMKHWIERALIRLQNLIDKANEKGRRRELGEHLEKRELLKKPSEQQRLLQEVPEVIAEKIESEVASHDLSENEKLQKDESPRPTLPRDSTLDNLSANGTLSNFEGVASEVIPKLSASDPERDDVNKRAVEQMEDGVGIVINVSPATGGMSNPSGKKVTNGSRDVDEKAAEMEVEGFSRN